MKEAGLEARGFLVGAPVVVQKHGALGQRAEPPNAQSSCPGQLLPLACLLNGV